MAYDNRDDMKATIMIAMIKANLSSFMSSLFFSAVFGTDRCEKPLNELSREDIKHCIDQYNK